jgi:ubiquitin conjugation factor E4 B
VASIQLLLTRRSYDEEYRVFLSKVPTLQTVFEYLVGCWKRLNVAKSVLLKKVCGILAHRECVALNYYKGYPPISIQKALELEEKMRHLIISYIGINFQAPDAFYAPAGFVRFSYCGSLAHVCC